MQNHKWFEAVVGCVNVVISVAILLVQRASCLGLAVTTLLALAGMREHLVRSRIAQSEIGLAAFSYEAPLP
jgi:hypothetical protein